MTLWKILEAFGYIGFRNILCAAAELKISLHGCLSLAALTHDFANCQMGFIVSLRKITCLTGKVKKINAFILFSFIFGHV